MSAILIIVITFVLVAVVLPPFIGLPSLIGFTAPITHIEASVVSLPGGGQAIGLFHRGGTTVPFIGPGAPLNVTYNGTPLKVSSSLPRFEQGDQIWLSRAPAPGTIQVSAIPPPSTGALPDGTYRVSIINPDAQILIRSWSFQVGGSPAPAPTTTPSLTPTPSPTPTPTPTPVPWSGFSVESWVRWDNPIPPVTNDRKWATIVVDGTSDSNRRYHLQHTSDNTAFEFAINTALMNRNWITSSTRPVGGVWYHVVGVYNQSPARLNLYVNGVREGQGSPDSSGLRASPNAYQVGGPAGVNYNAQGQRKFNGVISGLQTYERCLTDAEILAQYNRGAPVPTTPVPTPTPTPLPRTGFSTEAWIRWDNPIPAVTTDRQWATIVVDGTNDTNRRYHLQHTSDNTQFEFAVRTTQLNQFWTRSSTRPAGGVWYHLVGVYQQYPAQLSLYVNGVREGQGSPDSSGLRVSPNAYQVGGPAGISYPGPGSRKFDGTIRGLQSYEVPLTEAEVLSRYNQGVPSS